MQKEFHLSRRKLQAIRVTEFFQIKEIYTTKLLENATVFLNKMKNFLGSYFQARYPVLSAETV